MNELAEIGGVGRVPDSLWQRILAEPDRTPEWVALAAAERFAPQAEHWARMEGARRSPDQLARAAYRRHVRLSRAEGAALGIAGAYAAAADVVALLWIQSRMIFHIAAAYGFDPRHPMRPAELLALWEVYATPAEARQALDGAGKRMAIALTERALFSRRSEGLAVRLMKYSGKRVARKYAGRLIPLIGAPISAVQNAAVTKQLGGRALAYYGGDQARP